MILAVAHPFLNIPNPNIIPFLEHGGHCQLSYEWLTMTMLTLID